MITLEKLSDWLATSRENEHLEFKEAKQQYEVWPESWLKGTKSQILANS